MDLSNRLGSCNIIDIRALDLDALKKEQLQFMNPFLLGKEKQAQDVALKEIYDAAVREVHTKSPMSELPCREIEQPEVAFTLVGGPNDVVVNMLKSIREYGETLTRDSMGTLTASVEVPQNPFDTGVAREHSPPILPSP